LETRDADGETEVFEVTDDHPWYVEGAGGTRGDWVETEHLRPGQRIETADDRGLLILEIARTDRVERTYNLTVEGLHTFLVGEDGAVVHNCDPNKLHHIFGQAKHRLDSVVGKFGSRGAAFKAIQQATEEAVAAKGLSGKFETAVEVAGETINVRGIVMEGIVKIGTAFK
jgi:hypothetical protein